MGPHERPTGNSSVHLKKAMAELATAKSCCKERSTSDGLQESPEEQENSDLDAIWKSRRPQLSKAGQAKVANPHELTSVVGRVGFEPTITGARDQYPSRVLLPFDQVVPASRQAGPPPPRPRVI